MRIETGRASETRTDKNKQKERESRNKREEEKFKGTKGAEREKVGVNCS